MDLSSPTEAQPALGSPPSALAASRRLLEAWVLGRILAGAGLPPTDPEHCAGLPDPCRPEWFATGRHRDLLQAMATVQATGHPPAILPVADALEAAGTLGAWDGLPGLMALYGADAPWWPGATLADGLALLQRWGAKDRERDARQRLATGAANGAPPVELGALVDRVRRAADPAPAGAGGSSLPWRTAAAFMSADHQLPTMPFIVNPWIARGVLTMLEGPPKSAGKTTLALAMVRAALDGVPFLGRATSRTRVVYLTEERPVGFRLALQRADLAGQTDLHLAMGYEFCGREWAAVIAAAQQQCAAVNAALLVVDTLPGLSGLRGDAENDSGAALTALAPLQAAAAAGLAVLAIRHERKSGGLVGEAGRGSSAFAGGADVVLSLRPVDGGRPTVREIAAIGRLDVPPREMIERRADGTYDLLEWVERDGDVEILDVLEASIAEAPLGLTGVALVAQFAALASGADVRAGLRALVQTGRIRKSGGRSKGAVRYRVVALDSEDALPPVGGQPNGGNGRPANTDPATADAGTLL